MAPTFKGITVLHLTTTPITITVRKAMSTRIPDKWALYSLNHIINRQFINRCNLGNILVKITIAIEVTMKRIFFLTVILLTLNFPAFAQQDINSGNFIRNEICKGDGNSSACMAFVLGALNGMYVHASLSDTKLFFCEPNGVTNGQKRDVFIKYMNNNPEHMHENAAEILYVSLIKAFPCNTKSAH
jgi:hypothetical protein